MMQVARLRKASWMSSRRSQWMRSRFMPWYQADGSAAQRGASCGAGPFHGSRVWVRSAVVGRRRAAIVWIVPISRREAEFVSVNGWQRFESLLAEYDPDLLDLHREELPLPTAR
ncbi:suppressor of fused domain protein [Amycolatopsis sp. NPDC051128]|uniref:suppressor of fused domain protein n=1 Tax=Amycolatopsis sp. NPDC051128 TaxID=3155412 RepID=UPI0034499130